MDKFTCRILFIFIKKNYLLLFIKKYYYNSKIYTSYSANFLLQLVIKLHDMNYYKYFN